MWTPLWTPPKSPSLSSYWTATRWKPAGTWSRHVLRQGDLRFQSAHSAPSCTCRWPQSQNRRYRYLCARSQECLDCLEVSWILKEFALKYGFRCCKRMRAKCGFLLKHGVLKWLTSLIENFKILSSKVFGSLIFNRNRFIYRLQCHYY